MKKLLRIFALFVIPLAVGCQALPFVSPIVTGVVTWVNGEAHKYYENESDILYRSTKRALKDLSIPIEKDEVLEGGSYYVVAGDEDRFAIRIRPARHNITKVSIRINFMGDKPYAELIYKGIDENVDIIDFNNQGKPSKRNGRVFDRLDNRSRPGLLP